MGIFLMIAFGIHDQPTTEETQNASILNILLNSLNIICC